MKYAQRAVCKGKLVILVLAAILFCIPAAFSAQAPSISAQYAISRAIGMDQKGFHVHMTNRGASLENSSQDFTAMLTDDVGLKILCQGHHITMRLSSVGAGEKIVIPQVVDVKQRANRIVYDHGLIQQWFVNGPMGLQQGVTINKRPGKNKTGKLVLSLSVDSDLQPRPAIGSRGVDFVTTDENVVLQYTGLMVVDADTKQLPAHIETHRNQIDIVVDDRKAVYPVIVDPIFQQAKLTASDGAAHDMFGWAVAIQGNTVVVGAPGHDIGGNNGQGAAYVFLKRGNAWANMTQLAKLTASDGTSDDWFGSSVAISNGTIAIGAESAQSGNGSVRSGAAYIYVKPGSGWMNMPETAKLTPTDGIDMDRFGGSIAISGDTVVVGADGANIGSKHNQGKVYVFVKPGSGWTNMTETAQMTAGDGEAQDFLGSSVSIYGDIVAAGAPGDQSNQGSVYVFKRPQTGWTDIHQTAKLMASDGAPDDYLGFSVAIDKDTIVTGASDQTLAQVNQGAVYIFVKSGADWIDGNETAKFMAIDAMKDDHFGYAVAIDGNTIVVGSPYHNRTDRDPTGLPYYIPDMGAVYTFSRPSSGWHDLQAKAAMISSDGQANDHLGKSVAISGSTIVAGVPDQDLNGKTDQGSAYVFR